MPLDRARPAAVLVAAACGFSVRNASAEIAPPADVLTVEYGGAEHTFVRIKKGKLTQGSPVTEAGREGDEASRPVTITRDVWMQPHLVTRKDFAAFVDDARYLTEAERGQSGGFGWDGKALVQKKEFTWRNPGFAQTDDSPVVVVTWGDANAYAAWVARKVGRRARLPTEAEWEYAARGVTTTPWYAGASEQDALASGWFKANAGNGTRPVGQKPANPFGLFDMAGNVFEWCRDVYAPYAKGPAVDPEQTSSTPGEPERRVLRGGSWLRDPKRGRSAARYRATPGTRSAENGFRLVVTDEESLAPGTTGTRAGDGFSKGPTPIGSAAPDADAGVGANATPPVVTPSGDGAAWPLFLAPAAAAGAVVAWLLARRRAGATGPKGFGTRPGDDGFYVSAPAEARGGRVRWDAVVNGTVVSDVAPLESGEETFVYTGGRPSAIRILEVIPVAPSGYRAPSPPVPVPVPVPVPERRPAPTPASPPPVVTTTVVHDVITHPHHVVTHVHHDVVTHVHHDVVTHVHHDVPPPPDSPPSPPDPPPLDEPFLGTPRAY